MSNIKEMVKILIAILYYFLLILFPLFHPYLITIISYSELIAAIFLFTPIILLFLPFILRKKLNISEFNSIVYSWIVVIIFIILTLIGGYLTNNYFKTFSTEKWGNSNYCDMRYKMIESLEKKYSFVGMNREDIYNILGRTDNKVCMYDYEEEDNKICYMTHEAMMRYDFYCLYLDENDIVVGVKYESVR